VCGEESFVVAKEMLAVSAAFYNFPHWRELGQRLSTRVPRYHFVIAVWRAKEAQSEA